MSEPGTRASALTRRDAAADPHQPRVRRRAGDASRSGAAALAAARQRGLLKREDLQPIFSYKLRGAYNRIAHLTADERQRGVIAASAGNHAQGVAFAARHLGLQALIVMPQTTPEIKVDAVRDLGAEVVLAGDSYADAQARCDELAAERGMTFVHPFDDPLVIAGQGTVGDEILRHRLGDVSAIFVPVGGGGLIAGIGSYVKALRPSVTVIGVEPFGADAMYQSLAAGRRVVLDTVDIFADGVAVREVGAITFPIVQATVDEIVRVSNDEICAAIKDIFDDTRIDHGAGRCAGAPAVHQFQDGRGDLPLNLLPGKPMKKTFDRCDSHGVSSVSPPPDIRTAGTGTTLRTVRTPRLDHAGALPRVIRESPRVLGEARDR